jgi:CheY-like chemotaxis protein
MEKKAVLKNFLTEYGVLIVDKNPSSRNRLLKVMSDLGSKRNQIFTAASVNESKELIKNQKIGVVLSDYDIEGGSGFDLFKMVRELFPDQKKLCQILVTANVSQTAVAKAAEEDVDSFIIKPYTMQSIQENLLSTITFKVSPPAYNVKIDFGKELMAQQKLPEALQAFQEAQELHPKPSLALFYMGYVKFLMMDKNEAQTKYNSGLAINSIHFKCLVGLFDLQMNLKNFPEAYSVVKKIAKYFPANPDRLIEIIRLAVVTQNYDDMLMYYEVFTQLDERHPKVIAHIGAGLFVAGKYFMSVKDQKKALTLFEKIAVSCPEPKILKGIILNLIDQNLESELGKYLTRFQGDQLKGPEYLLCDYLSSYAFSTDYNVAIQKGMDLYNHDYRDFHLLQTLLLAFEKQNLMDKAQAMREEIAKLYPDKVLKVAS